MNEKKYEENYELIQELAGQTNDIVTALRKETFDLENVCADLTDLLHDSRSELTEDSYEKLDQLGDRVIKILNVLEAKQNAPYDNYFALLEKIDPEPWEKLEGGLK